MNYLYSINRFCLLPPSRLCFYTCLSVIMFTGRDVCLSAGWDTHTPGSRTPLEADTPPRSRHPPASKHPPGSRQPPLEADTLPGSRHPLLHSACWEIRPTSGRYASYWNAYLFKIDVCFIYYLNSNTETNTYPDKQKHKSRQSQNSGSNNVVILNL